MRLSGALPGRNPGRRTRCLMELVTRSLARSTSANGISISSERLQSTASATARPLNRGRRELRRLAQSFGSVGCFPGECVFSAPEVAESGGFAVNRAAKIQVLDHACGGQRKAVADDLRQSLII